MELIMIDLLLNFISAMGSCLLSATAFYLAQQHYKNEEIYLAFLWISLGLLIIANATT